MEIKEVKMSEVLKIELIGFSDRREIKGLTKIVVNANSYTLFKKNFCLEILKSRISIEKSA